MGKLGASLSLLLVVCQGCGGGGGGTSGDSDGSVTSNRGTSGASGGAGGSGGSMSSTTSASTGASGSGRPVTSGSGGSATSGSGGSATAGSGGSAASGAGGVGTATTGGGSGGSGDTGGNGGSGGVGGAATTGGSGGGASCPGATPDSCGDLCVDLAYDNSHCGDCGAACDAGDVCVLGYCIPDCGYGETVCSDECVDTESDPRHCGNCGIECSECHVCMDGACRDPRLWATGEALRVGDIDRAEDPLVEAAGSGQFIAAWVENESFGGPVRVYTNRFDPETLEWDTPAPVFTISDDLWYHYLAVGQSGDAVVTVERLDFDYDAIEFVGFRGTAIRFDHDAETWDSPVSLVQGDPDYGAGPFVGLDDAGNAVAVWLQGAFTSLEVLASRYDREAGTWEPGLPLQGTNTGDARELALAVHREGDAIAAWRQDGDEVWVAQYDAGADGWSEASQIEPVGVGTVWEIEVGMDGAGNAYLVWKDGGADPVPGGVWASRLSAGSDTWDAPQRVAEHDYSQILELDVTRNGHVMAAWAADGNFWSSRYDAALNSWGPPRLVAGDPPYGGSIVGELDLDDEGNAIVVGMQDGDVAASRNCVATDTWDASDILSTSDSEPPTVAMDGSGNTVALWTQPGGSYDYSDIWWSYAH